MQQHRRPVFGGGKLVEPALRFPPPFAIVGVRQRFRLELPRQIAGAIDGAGEPIAGAHREHRRGVGQDCGGDDQREGGERIRLRIHGGILV
jgi:hypothetical protein